MGLDASVRCRCFEEGKTKEPPVPNEWLGIDEDGYLGLKPEYEDKEEEYWHKLYEWEQDCCAHEGMDFASERISNWTGYRLFQEALARCDRRNYLVLDAELPNANGGLMTPELASKSLEELEHFESLESIGENVFLIELPSEEVVWEYVDGYEGVFVLSGLVGLDAGIAPPNEFYIRDRETKNILFSSSHFKQIRERPQKSESSVVFQDQETGNQFECDLTISGQQIPWPDGRMENNSGQCNFKYPEEMKVIRKSVGPDNFDYLINALKTIFKASVETGNPVRWC